MGGKLRKPSGLAKKKIGEQSEPRGSPSQTTTKLACQYFSYFTLCFAFFPHYGAWSQATNLYILKSSEVMNKINDTVIYLFQFATHLLEKGANCNQIMYL